MSRSPMSRWITAGLVVLVLVASGTAVGYGEVAGAAALDSEAAQSTFIVEQNGQTFEVTPLRTGETIEEFYGFSTQVRDSANTTTGIERNGTSELFLWSGPQGLSLVVIHDGHDTSGGAATFAFTGLPADGHWAVRDDNPGNDDWETDRVEWDWNSGVVRTDGGAFRGEFGEAFEITVEPTFTSGIDRWQFLSGDADSPTRTQLDMNESVTIRRPGDEVTLALQPSAASVAPNQTATFDLVATGIDAGVGSYELAVNVTDTSTATITEGDNQIGGTGEVRVAADGSGVRVGAFAGDTTDTGPVTVATVTLTGDAAGTTGLSVRVMSVANESGAQYAIGSPTNATLTVRPAPDVTGDGNPAADPDGDGLYEDVNGDGETTPGDATVLFNAVFRDDPAVMDNVALFDFNEDGTLAPGDATVLFEDIFG